MRNKIRLHVRKHSGVKVGERVTVINSREALCRLCATSQIEVPYHAMGSTFTAEEVDHSDDTVRFGSDLWVPTHALIGYEAQEKNGPRERSTVAEKAAILKCSLDHPLHKISLGRLHGYVHERLCHVCGRSIHRDEARYRCSQGCDINLCLHCSKQAVAKSLGIHSGWEEELTPRDDHLDDHIVDHFDPGFELDHEAPPTLMLQNSPSLSRL